MRELLIINQSTLVPHSDLEMMVAALQKQITLHLYPWWGVDAKVRTLKVPPDTKRFTEYPENIRMVDRFTHLKALGFHTVRPDGVPQGYVAPGSFPVCLDEVSASLSHEAGEQLVNPSGRRMVLVPLPAIWGELGGQTVLVPEEPFDPVEDSEYRLDGCNLSNFVYPAWFTPEIRKPSNGYDFLGVLNSAMELAPGGYIDVSKDLKSWKSYGLRKPKDAFFSRSARRALDWAKLAILFAGT